MRRRSTPQSATDEPALPAAAYKLAVRHYLRRLNADPFWSYPALIFPGIGNILVFYAPTLVIAHMLERFSTGGTVVEWATVWPYLAIFAGIWAGGELCWRLCGYFIIRHEFKTMERMYVYAMEQLLQKDPSFFHDNFAGSLTKKAIGYSNNYERFVDTLSFAIFSQVIPLAFVFYILGGFSPWLVIVLLGLIIVTIAAVQPIVRRRMKLVNVREAASNRVSGHFADVISNMDAVMAYANEQGEQRTLRHHVADYMAKAKRSADYQNIRVEGVTAPLYVLTNLAGLALALYLSRNGQFNVATVFVTFNYFAAATRIVWEFNRIYRQLEAALTEAAQFTAHLLEKPTVTDPVNPKKLRVPQGAISFENVSFGYDENTGKPLFKDLTLHIASGERVALVGHSGGGKSTLTKLLLRFMDVSAGRISIDGQDIAAVRRTALRRAIAYVPQEPLMFHRSLRANIAYGRQQAGEDEIRAAARLAHADDFINDLPAGYDTLVGERGIKLSGGQRQRVALARSFLKDAPILLLDEATSALDSESEHLIQDALWKLMKGRTAIVIAHRLSTIQRMDRIVVLESGRIIEQGTHDELLAHGGTYAKLWARQSGGFIAE